MTDEQMTEITEQEFQDQFDDIMKRIEEDKEYFLIRREDGSAVVAAPITEELEPLLDIMPTIEYDDEVPGEPSF
jgi:PHD/YefM family antitoxin component YafN of YafNO toxin-antitoxin module